MQWFSNFETSSSGRIKCDAAALVVVPEKDFAIVSFQPDIPLPSEIPCGY